MELVELFFAYGDEEAGLQLVVVGQGYEAFMLEESQRTEEPAVVEVVGVADFFEVEIETAVETGTHGYLVVVADGAVGVLDEVYFRVVVVETFNEAFVVALAVEQHGVGFFVVASGATGFLEVSLK